MKYYLLGGSGTIGTSMSKLFNSSNIKFEIIGRNSPLSSIVNPDFNYIDSNDFDFRNDILVYMLPGNRHENIKNITSFCNNFDKLNFKTVIFFSSISSFKSFKIDAISELTKKNDPYGKRYCEIYLTKNLLNTKITILRLGMVINAKTRWDDFITRIRANDLRFPPYKKVLPIASVDDIFETITNLPKETYIHLPNISPSLTALDLVVSTTFFSAFYKYMVYLFMNLNINNLKLFKFIFLKDD